jgi:hypothetical protein
MNSRVGSNGDYKLIELFETGEVELYNLKTDISESNDLANEMPAKRENYT